MCLYFTGSCEIKNEEFLIQSLCWHRVSFPVFFNVGLYVREMKTPLRNKMQLTSIGLLLMNVKKLGWRFYFI